MTKTLRFALGCSVVLSMVSFAQAQQRPGGFQPGGFGGGNDPINLINNAAIRRDLEVDEETAAKIREIREEMDREVQAAREKIAAQYSEKLNTVLLPHQSDRLLGISIQLRGVNALQDPVVAKKLGLSESQQKELSTKLESLAQRTREGFRTDGGERPSREDLQARFQQIREEREGLVKQILTASQQKQLEELSGAEFDRSQLFQGRGPGGAGGQGTRPGQGGTRRPGGNN